MPETNVVTYQPVSSAANNSPSAPPENVVVTQPLNKENMHITLNEAADNVEKDMHVSTYSFAPPSAPDQTDLRVNGDEKIVPELTRADAMKAEDERRRQRRNDFCCFACADSYADTDDVFCWYMFLRCYCQCLGHFCEGVSNCTDSCCEGCGSCLGSCCECGDQDGCCDGCCGDGAAGDGGCCGDGAVGDGGCCGDGAAGDGGCCDGGGGDAVCDCDCGGCFN